MKKFCVSYDLENGDSNDYYNINKLFEELRGEYVLKNVWILELNNRYTCKSLFVKLSKLFAEYDMDLYVAQVIDSFSS